MKYSDVFKPREDLEILTNDYEKDFKEKNPNTPITIEGTTYLLKTSEYENLMQILTETGTKLEEIKDYQLLASGKYFGISIENGSINKLQINEYELKKIPYLQNLNQLQQLKLESNKISKIEGLENLTQLEKLDLYGNQLSKIEGLQTLKKLQKLYLSFNQLSKIEGLENLNQLTGLTLNGNQLSKIEGLENLNQLTKLNLGYNQLIASEEYDKAVKKLRQKGVEVNL